MDLISSCKSTYFYVSLNPYELLDFKILFFTKFTRASAYRLNKDTDITDKC